MSKYSGTSRASFLLIRISGRDIDDEGVVKTPAVRKSRSPVGLTSIVPATQTRPRESSQERADKKRELLKRQLEEKAKVSTKKKRKF